MTTGTPHSVSRSVLLFGATGTIGRAVLAELLVQGHDVTVVGRTPIEGAWFVAADVTKLDDLNHYIPVRPYDAVISCLASRTGVPSDAWAIDHDAHQGILTFAKARGIGQFVLLSAICVQRPKLAFQKAKLKFEARLKESVLRYSIVRPTAYFKSLSGQVARVRAGKPFLVFREGKLTACKPISDRDLAAYIVRCLWDDELQNQVLPIGGPGPAITPLDQVAMLENVLGEPVKVRRVPIAMISAIIGLLSFAGLVSGRARDKAELAKIGRYYATESMLVYDAKAGRYDADATLETGSDTLQQHYADLVAGRTTVDLGEHAMF